jgi:hypothetical protein
MNRVGSFQFPQVGKFGIPLTPITHIAANRLSIIYRNLGSKPAALDRTYNEHLPYPCLGCAPHGC